jgi:hypothetical protein
MEAIEAARGFGSWNGLIEEMHMHLHAHGIEPENPSIVMSSWLELDTKTGRFIGQGSERANTHLRRTYRAPFVVPEIA